MVVVYDVKTTDKNLNSDVLIDRRIDLSGDMADYVYKYEDKINELIEVNNKSGSSVKSWDEINQLAEDTIRDDLPNAKIVDSMYDQETGIAALAVEDELTGETYISYAGTNWKADGIKDVVSDVRIGVNDSLGLRQLGDKATSFYDRVQSQLFTYKQQDFTPNA